MTVRLDQRWSINDIPAVVMDNGILRVVVLPALGGKILQVSSRRNGRDFLWENNRLALRRVPFGAAYDDVFFGGWDELFPNDVPEEVAGEEYPDHGELWAAPWRCVQAEVEEGSARLVLEFETPISQCSIRKTITLAEGANAVQVTWRLRHDGPQELPYLWKQHVAVPVSETARLDLPASSMYIEDFGSPRAGTPGTTYQWPFLTDDHGKRHDMHSTMPPDSHVAEFQYATDMHGGWCAVTYADGTGIGLAFDPEVFRSCWTFASYGGWRGAEVLVLEPCTGYPVSLADGLASGTHRILRAGEVIETTVALVVYDGMSEVTSVALDGQVAGVRYDEKEPVA
ncbi:MAG: hypothetical protein ACXVXY_04815 [Mycobacteriaceae bacterium]